jgi:hypothetical protein
LREPGIGRVTASESCSAWRSNSEGTAFMAFVLFVGGRSGGATTPAMACFAKLPYAGLNRIRFEGSVSTGATRAVPPLRQAFHHGGPPRATGGR